MGRWTPAQTGGRSLPQPADEQQFQRWSGMDDQQQPPQERWQPTYNSRQVRLLLLRLLLLPAPATLRHETAVMSRLLVQPPPSRGQFMLNGMALKL